MTSLFSLRRVDFPLSLHRNPCRQLITHVVRLLNRRHTAGLVTRFVKVKAHCGEPLNEAADALASAAAEAEDSQLPSLLHLDTNAVHFYINGAPVEWGARLRDYLIQAAADRAAEELGRPKQRRDGSEKPVPITTAWMLRQDQGRQVLGRILRGRKPDSAKRRVLQTLAGVFPGNAILCRWKLRATATCDLCACPAETQAHIQCVCPALKGARIAAHHTLAGMVFDWVRKARGGWDVHRELTVSGLRGIPVPEDATADWHRMCDELTDRDIAPETDADPALDSGIRRKRPDGWALHWGRRMIRLLEFTRCNDYRPAWRRKPRGSSPCTVRSSGFGRPRTAAGPCILAAGSTMRATLPRGWSVEIINFTLGIRGSFAETQWMAALTALGVPATRVTHLMTDLVAQCLTELNELYSTRAAALRQRANA